MSVGEGRGRARLDSAGALARGNGRVAAMAAMVVAVALLGTAACTRPTRPLAHTLDSPAAVARATADALSRGDEARLAALVLDEREFREVVWPEIPASRPARNLSADYVWADLAQKSRQSLTQTLARHRGAPLDVVDIEWTGETTAYPSFTVHRRTRITLRTPDGQSSTVKLFGSLIEQNGRYKIFSYAVD